MMNKILKDGLSDYQPKTNFTSKNKQQQNNELSSPSNNNQNQNNSQYKSLGKKSRYKRPQAAAIYNTNKLGK